MATRLVQIAMDALDDAVVGAVLDDGIAARPRGGGQEQAAENGCDQQAPHAAPQASNASAKPAAYAA